jgi:hypothetical protein
MIDGFAHALAKEASDVQRANGVNFISGIGEESFKIE